MEVQVWRMSRACSRFPWKLACSREVFKEEEQGGVGWVDECLEDIVEVVEEIKLSLVRNLSFTRLGSEGSRDYKTRGIRRVGGVCRIES